MGWCILNVAVGLSLLYALAVVSVPDGLVGGSTGWVGGTVCNGWVVGRVYTG